MELFQALPHSPSWPLDEASAGLAASCQWLAGYGAGAGTELDGVPALPVASSSG